MVGVPGRSKACKTCKKRKIACTLEKPQCKICIKSNRECLGYDQERTFILDMRTRKQMLKVEAKELTLDTPPGKTDLPTDSLEVSTHIQGSISTKDAYSSFWKISPSTRSVYREQIICEFLHNYLPENLLQESPSSQGIMKTWWSLLPSHPNFTTALEATVLAICTSKLGHLHNDPALVHESLKFYIQGLWELQRALYAPELMYRAETAASCIALVMYEVMECPDRSVKAWAKHVQGCSKLFELRGPKAYNTEFEHEIFLSFRQMEIQDAISYKRKTFLSSPEWATYPWKGYKKPHFHYLLDIQAELASEIASATEYLSSADAVANPFTLLPFVTGVIQRAWKMDTRLQAFFKRLGNQNPGPLYWARLSNGFNRSIQGEEGAAVFPVAFQFDSLDTARTCTLYWATLAIHWSGLRFIYSLLGNPDDPLLSANTGIPPLGHRSDPSSVAKNICQSVEYMIQQSPEAGAVIAVFPLKVAVETFGDARDTGCDRELDWAKRVLERIGGGGVKILHCLNEPIEKHSFIPAPDKVDEVKTLA